MRLDVHHLRVVRAIAGTESLSQAAVSLGITQPAVSAQLKRLEQLLGFRLFDRGEGGVVATPMGELLLRRTTAVLPQMDKLLEDIEQRTSLTPPARMRVGAVCSALVAHLPTLVSELWPDVSEVSVVHDDSSERLLSLLADRRLDLVVIKDYPGRELSPPREVDTAAIVVEPTFVLLPEAHRLAHRRRVDLADLQDESFVLMDNSSSAPFNEMLADTCARLGFVPRVSHLVNSQPVAQQVVRANAVGFAQPICEEHAGIVVRALCGDQLRRRHVLAWGRDTFVVERKDELLAAVVDAYWAEARDSPVYRRYLPCGR